MLIKRLAAAFTLVSMSLFAQTPSDVAKAAHLANINTLLIFTSQEGLNSGHYNFSNVGVRMDLYHLPFIYHFHSDTKLNSFVVGNVGYSRVYLNEDIEIPDGVRLDYDNHLRTYTAGLGGGLRYKLIPTLSILGGVEFIYSTSGVSIKKPKGHIGDVIEDFFNKNYNQNISYKFFTSLEYRQEIEGYKPYAIVNYKIYDTKSTFTFDTLSKIQTQSSITTLSLGVESPKLMEFSQNYLTLEGYYHANFLSGSVKDVVKFGEFNALGSVLYYYTPDKPWWASRFFFELNAVKASGLDGYNVGVGFTVDF